MTIAITACREKIRRKELYIVSIIGIFILILFGTGGGTLSINGTAITDYKMLAPILLIVVNAISCALAVVLSLSTIPNEYERHTSHLIWMRGVSQSRYHGELALANILASLASEAILFIAMLLFMISNQKLSEGFRLLPAFLLIGINVVAVSLFTSALSIVLPKLAAGAIATAFMLAGVFHAVIDLFQDILGGFAGALLKYILLLVPDLHSIQSQAANVLCGEGVDIHTLLKGLLAIYIFIAFILIFKRKEA